MSLRGNGLEWPVVEGDPGAEEADRAGETAVLPRVTTMRWGLREEVLDELLGEAAEVNPPTLAVIAGLKVGGC